MFPELVVVWFRFRGDLPWFTAQPQWNDHGRLFAILQISVCSETGSDPAPRIEWPRGRTSPLTYTGEKEGGNCWSQNFFYPDWHGAGSGRDRLDPPVNKYKKRAVVIPWELHQLMFSEAQLHKNALAQVFGNATATRLMI